MAGFHRSFQTLCFILFVVFSLCFNDLSAELLRFRHPVTADGSLSFLVVGDWGRRGSYNQSEVAFQMGRIGERLNIDFVVSTGDNFYDDGLTGIFDPAFEESFTNIYTARSLQKQWYNVLGNHDYRGDVLAQLHPFLTVIDRRWLCLRSYVVETAVADFFFVDTTPFVDKYFLKPKDHHYDWRGVLPRKNYLSKQLKDLDIALKNSAANWKIVVGHHTMRSVGHHGDTQEIVEQFLPILKENKVDMYINGHDHCLQHVTSTTSPIQFLTSGGGSKAWKNDTGNLDREGVKFYHDGQGFMSVELTRSSAKIMFYDVYGRELHDLKVSRDTYLYI